MAEFCRQCAERRHIPWYTKAPPGESQTELCEGCGWTWVDEDGYCLSAEHKHELPANVLDVAPLSSQTIGKGWF